MPTDAHPPLPDANRLLSAPAAYSARLLCRHHAHRANSAFSNIETGGSPGVSARHDLRVALRRLRVTLEAYRSVLKDTVPEKLERRTQTLARKLGVARDRDVMHELMQHVAMSRTAPQRAALDGIEIHEPHDHDGESDVTEIRRRWLRIEASLRDATETWSEQHRIDEPRGATSFGTIAADALDRAADRVARRCAAASRRDDMTALHSARLALKTARYLLAPLATSADDAPALLDALRDAQNQLGEIHDAHALRTRLRDLATHRPDMPPPNSAAIRAIHASERDLDDRIGLAFAALESWRTPASLIDYVARLRAVADTWRQGVAPPMEIERKWLLSALPPRVRGLTPALLRQGYLAGETLVERIRSVTTSEKVRWIRTVKLGRGMARIEVEEVTTDVLGEALFALTHGRRVEKQRYAVHEGEFTWEIDNFTDRALVLAECELTHEHARVELPVWLAPYVVREVTGESEFTNWKLAR
jgi:CYTH domain-containing protein/CHAD domain-containing protein